LYHSAAIEGWAARQDLISLLAFTLSSGWLRQSATLLAAIATDLNDTANAEQHCDEAKKLSQKHGSLQLKRMTFLASSAAALANSNFPQARRDLDAWMRLGVSDAFQRVIAANIGAEIATAARAYSAALKYAERALSEATSLGSARAMGAALRTIATIEFRRGHLHAARERIDDAITLIEGHGSPASLQRAVSLRGRIATTV
jgi:hypothetical protein